MDINELNGRLKAGREELAGIYAKYKGADGISTMPQEVIEQVQQKQKSLLDLNTQLKTAQHLAQIEEENEIALKEMNTVVNHLHMADDATVRRALKSIPDEIFNSQQFKESLNVKSNKNFSVELKGRSIAEIGRKSITTATGFEPYNPETNIVTPLSQPYRRMVTDIIPQITTGLSVIKWREQTLRARPSEMGVAEGGTKQQGNITYAKKSTEVKKRAVHVITTDEQLDDVPTFRSLIDMDLRDMIDEDAEEQIIRGDGEDENLEGFLTNSSVGSIATGAEEPVPDAVHRGITAVRIEGHAEPTDLIMHPNDYHDYRTLRTADGLYINGNPADGRMIPMWGMMPVVTAEMTENTTLLGAFARYSRLWLRKGFTLKVGYINNQLITNEQTILAEHRLALTILRPQAFQKVTGI